MVNFDVPFLFRKLPYVTPVIIISVILWGHLLKFVESHMDFERSHDIHLNFTSLDMSIMLLK